VVRFHVKPVSRVRLVDATGSGGVIVELGVQKRRCAEIKSRIMRGIVSLHFHLGGGECAETLRSAIDR
jgi:hypothetical protein